MASIEHYPKSPPYEYSDVRWREAGVQRRKRFRRNKHKMETINAFYRRVLAIEALGANAVGGDISFGYLIDELWWPAAFDELSGSTRGNYKSMVSNHIPDKLRRKLVQNITVADLNQLLRDLSKTHAAGTVKKLRTILSSIYKEGVNRNLVPANIVRELTTPRRVREAVEDDEGVVSKEQVIPPVDVWKIADEIHPNFRELTLFLAFSGVRIGEASGLRVADLDLEKGTVKIDKAQSTASAANSETGEARETSRVKSRTSRRVIWMPEDLVAVMADHLKGKGKNDWVFTMVKGKKMHPGNYRRRYFNPTAAECGHDGRTPHDLRHTCASMLIEAGASPAAVAAHLGHKDASVTMSVYAGWWDESKESLAGVLQTAMESSKPESNGG